MPRLPRPWGGRGTGLLDTDLVGVPRDVTWPGGPTLGEDTGMNLAARDGHDAVAPCPPSVRYASGLLMLQGSLWAVVSVACGVLAGLAASAAPPVARHVVWFIAAGTIAAGMSAASFLLAVRLQRRMRGARAGAVGLEAFMTCFGVLAMYYGAWVAAGGGIVGAPLVMPGLGGTALSATAAVVLLGRKARAFTRAGRRNAAAGC